ncbi:GTP cyclohydrolase II [Paenibacillus psychroresistens]|uniref:GTP cyclohydrolase II n=1 Tax=Paenibacillus psychroresistens TaxID=1778678 RepID=A0A6B8REZ8_9BACL|nr:GTP cyclohydrolase II [Paenibacillus psychroresistens]QGQ94052.1 GTP cyclohydrolase II [Paenibacillus psychroresistens]
MLTDQVKLLLKKKIQITQEPGKPALSIVGPIKLPIQLEQQELHFQWYTWLTLENITSDTGALLDILPELDLASMQQSSVLVYGDFQNSDKALIRMHSICHTGDIFGSKRCDCGFQLKESMRMIAEHGSGAIFYLANHEGRGIGLFAKSLAYLLQEEGLDTVEANHSLGFEDDTRSYDEAIRVLHALRQKPVTLITNNPKKIKAMQDKGVLVDSHLPLWGDVSKFNHKYLATKINKSGHIPAASKTMYVQRKVAQ